MLKQILTRAIFALKTPSPDGSKHYQSGWDDGLEAAIDAVARVFDQLPPPADRAAVLLWAADQIEEAQHRRDDIVDDALGFLDNNTEQQHLAVHRAGKLLRRLAAEAPPSPCGRSQAISSPCSAGDWCCQGPVAEASEPATQIDETQSGK